MAISSYFNHTEVLCNHEKAISGLFLTEFQYETAKKALIEYCRAIISKVTPGETGVRKEVKSDIVQKNSTPKVQWGVKEVEEVGDKSYITLDDLAPEISRKRNILSQTLLRNPIYAEWQILRDATDFENECYDVLANGSSGSQMRIKRNSNDKSSNLKYMSRKPIQVQPISEMDKAIIQQICI